MKHPFKEELDRMENAGIISKYCSLSGPAPEVVKLFFYSQKVQWVTSYLFRSNRSQQTHSSTCM